MRSFLRTLVLISCSAVFFLHGMSIFSSDKEEETTQKTYPSKKRKPRDIDHLNSSETKRVKTAEAFLTKDLLGFTKKSTNQYTCTDDQFDAVFPICDQKNVNKSVGQIQANKGKLSKKIKGQKTLGTGTILKIVKDGVSNKIKIKGITAKHVLFNEEGNPRFGEFIQASRGINSGPDKGKVTSLCRYTINKIFTHHLDDRDIALFEAVSPAKSAKELALLSTIEVSALVKRTSSSKNAIIYHYPMGVKEQRRNTGTIDSATDHLVTTLPGSSGAAVLNKQKKVISVHVSSGVEGKKKVKYNGSRLPHLKGEKFSVSDENEYVSIVESDLSDFTTEHNK